MLASKSGRAFLSAALLCLGPAAMAQNFTVDFGRSAGPPLVKDKFGVYQTPFLSQAQLLASTKLLAEIGVENFRYEIAWGKPDALAHDQISGTAAQPHLDFSMLDSLVSTLKAEQVQPLLALTYTPNPLKTRTDWGAWQDMPSDLNAWAEIVQSYTAHFRTHDGLRGSLYEVWNEPDTPVPGGKMFFTGNPDDYARLYAATAVAIHAGDPDAGVGGPAIAYDMRYVMPILAMPMDFASIHAYGNYPAQIANMRQALAARPEVPIYLTEYASYGTFGPNAPVSRFPAAARFFQDVSGLLEYPDVTKVYWAQWVDDNLGMITHDGHPRALFNAFRIYGMMSTDRVSVSPSAQNGVGTMASADSHTAAVVLWNTETTTQTLTVHLTHLPIVYGTLRVFRIDSTHSSFVDNPATAAFAPVETRKVSGDTVWSGALPGESVVFLTVSDGHSTPHSSLPGTYIRTRYWFPDRSSPAYADFDPRTFTARLGMGDAAQGTSVIGVEIGHPTARIWVQTSPLGPQTRPKTMLFGLRLDFPLIDGHFGRGTLLRAPGRETSAVFSLPWEAAAAKAHTARTEPDLESGKPFSLDLAQFAPPNWDHQKILMTFVLRDAGAGAQEKITIGADP